MRQTCQARPHPAAEASKIPLPEPVARIPLVHITDLYHPPQDPDDHIDLATVFALQEFDLRAVILDVTEKFLRAAPEGWDVARDPGRDPVVRLGQVTGRSIPVAVGPTVPLTHPSDTAEGRPGPEQAGIALLLDVLEQVAEPAVISVVGSCRVLAAAFNRRPGLVRAKTRCVLLNAGSTGGAKLEWNVGLDPAAYIALWRSGLPVCWYPCATARGAFNPAHERGTYWKATHAEIFRGLAPALQTWFGQSFSGDFRRDAIHALPEDARASAWETVLAGERNMWSTASLVMGAGRVLARTAEGWRFVPAATAAGHGLRCWPWRLDPIDAAIGDDARVRWRETTGPARTWLFGRRPGTGYGRAMAEALNALLRGIAC